MDDGVVARMTKPLKFFFYFYLAPPKKIKTLCGKQWLTCLYDSKQLFHVLSLLTCQKVNRVALTFEQKKKKSTKDIWGGRNQNQKSQRTFS